MNLRLSFLLCVVPTLVLAGNELSKAGVPLPSAFCIDDVLNTFYLGKCYLETQTCNYTIPGAMQSPPTTEELYEAKRCGYPTKQWNLDWRCRTDASACVAWKYFSVAGCGRQPKPEKSGMFSSRSLRIIKKGFREMGLL
ncbi:hypothetical protein JDV02_005548 [Purpureocillium takamizusanense]|uniref:Uncharacterized protein n=1 Tax=Purpureocillium takamizusanense TaxID=2060973 RepID=A0A9Q8QHJ2_9HYPO|nr:uncharacterized protein JDV02_005548 [Purpureocillium takamizusanense]UNI19362.1 hypothetical protein JDV02_005548 [Purpureocillium takamizusanense]